MKRIKYKKEGVMLLTQRFLVPQMSLQGLIDTSNHNVQVHDDVTGEFVANHNTTSLHAAKKLLKELLKSYGVTFMDEVRTKYHKLQKKDEALLESAINEEIRNRK